MRQKIDTPYKVVILPKYNPLIREGRELAKVIPVDSTFDIPYVCGYPIRLTQVYWDRHMPKTMMYKGRSYNLKVPLCTHECVEKLLEDAFDLPYLKAHYIATDIEKTVVDKMGLPWDVYNKFCNKYIKEIGSEDIKRVPRDLDLKPYYDEHESKDIYKMKAAMV